MPISKKVRTKYRREEKINPSVKVAIALVEAGLATSDRTGDRIRVFIVACRLIDANGYVTVSDAMGENLYYRDPERHYVSDQLCAFMNSVTRKKNIPKALMKNNGETIPGTTRPHNCIVFTVTGKKLWQILKEGRE